MKRKKIFAKAKRYDVNMAREASGKFEIMKQSKLVLETISRVSEWFKGKKDRGGQSYIYHLLRVMGLCPSGDEDLQIAALLHDCIEDEVCSLAELEQIGYNDRVLRIVKTLTHLPEDSYECYIEKISEDRDAVVVKLADLRDNMDISRLKRLSDKDLERLKKYHKSYIFLKSKL